MSKKVKEEQKTILSGATAEIKQASKEGGLFNLINKTVIKLPSVISEIPEFLNKYWESYSKALDKCMELRKISSSSRCDFVSSKTKEAEAKFDVASQKEKRALSDVSKLKRINEEILSILYGLKKSLKLDDNKNLSDCISEYEARIVDLNVDYEKNNLEIIKEDVEYIDKDLEAATKEFMNLKNSKNVNLASIQEKCKYLLDVSFNAHKLLNLQEAQLEECRKLKK